MFRLPDTTPCADQGSSPRGGRAVCGAASRLQARRGTFVVRVRGTHVGGGGNGTTEATEGTEAQRRERASQQSSPYLPLCSLCSLCPLWLIFLRPWEARRP
ncbi:MAG: hypothetical protein AVDCRST_MAG64-2150 [uncultured Phycisphaerae bacterium]|uniref:Uncharacterized protein n=1 Tax=uncultured Phycisphaerae bacterium TaxID=904963 RepID=A0A6J4PDF1_9BACT|nr:MAG: hypothetical protein AVDCRST_MAG64-2150 [uncultured Phycisphaerae bacterium]